MLRARRRLLYTEITRFPDLLDIVEGHGTDRIIEARADRFARLPLTGHLCASDPDQAAEQSVALFTGSVEIRSRLGTRPISGTEVREVVRAGVHTFRQAFAMEPIQAP